MRSEPSDGELLESWCGGEQAAGKELFDRYYDPIERFFLNKLTSNKLASEVDDLVQETFERCLRSRDRLADSSKFRSFLFAIAYRVFQDHLRQRYKQKVPLSLDEVSLADLSAGVTTLVAQRRQHRLLLQGLRSIPILDQVVLELHYWEHLTTEEMADVLRVPVGTARGRLGRARAKLEKVLAKLAESPQLLQSTLARLEDWAAECRRQLGQFVRKNE